MLRIRSWSALLSVSTLFLAYPGLPAQAQSPGKREFPVGALSRLEELPASRLRTELGGMSHATRETALQWLRSFHFTERDLPSLHADAAGGIFYVCEKAGTSVTATAQAADVGQAAVPVSPFPSHLFFHSKPGAPNVLYINFSGMTVINTEWNTVVGRSEIPAVAFSTDTDLTTFSDAEQVAIKRIWQRMAEDYAAFNIDVTTEPPASLSTRTAVALITRTTDANGALNPYDTAGGVAYVNVFGSTSYASYRPAWIYHNNLANDESFIAEAASHEIGHNMGLSHDGCTDGSEYYGGHGSGDTSWGPLMGTGYYRNVSQWSKGEYYLANNTQDDLATIAGKISYRTDDHGNTTGTATTLTLTAGTNIVSTTPENDPGNTNTVNKGVLERNTDLDVFSFVTGTGPIKLAVNPWIMPAGTRGGNADIVAELYDGAGVLLLTNNPSSQTSALLQTNLSQGRYFLHVRNSGTGAPFSSAPSGYTTYGSIGQYFISGFVTASSNFIVAPVAEMQVSDLTQSGQATKQVSVTFSDDVAIDTSTIDVNDLRITGPNGYDRMAQSVTLSSTANGTPRTATYAFVPASGGTWCPVDNGIYTVWMRTNQVADTEGAWVAAGELGQFKTAVPVTIYAANMDVDPGWVLEPDWQYGVPAYGSGGPTGGFSGTKIIAYNLSGYYANNLSVKCATTPAINCTGTSTLTLRFKRWLRTRQSDAVAVEASTDGTTWVTLWSSSSAMSDSSWQEVQYLLPAGFAGSSSVRLRWSLSSNVSKNEIGWNLDDVELLGDGSLDANPPVATLNVSALNTGGSPSHACSVTYTDETAVRLSSLDSADLVVAGPNGYSNLVEFVGADLPLDGTPITAAYSIAGPGGVWDAADNGSYTVTLLEGAVQDTLNNANPETMLGTFNVSISIETAGELAVSPDTDLTVLGTVGGPFSPDSMVYTLTNVGGSSLDWSVSKSQTWTSISASGGSLAAGASTNVTVSINPEADNLAAGSYTNIVLFNNESTGLGNTTRPVSLTLSPPMAELTVSVNNPDWGCVTPGSGTFAVGSSVQLTGSPAVYFSFNQWSGSASGTNNPLTLLIETNSTVLAFFSEKLTTNHPTPLWWLASKGYTNDFETAVTQIGANGMALWESYIAGLEPSDPQSRLLLHGSPVNKGAGVVLHWNTVSNRIYSIWRSTNLAEPFAPLPGGTNLPWTTMSLTNATEDANKAFYKLEVNRE